MHTGTIPLALLTSAVLALASGCQTVGNPLFCNNAAPCDPDSDTPYCDFAGDFGPSNTCVANPVDAGIDLDGSRAVPDASQGVPDAQPVCECVDDGIDCTDDSCETDGDDCIAVPNHAMCPEKTPSCHPTMGCVAQTCERSADCDDGIFCNGTETCAIATGNSVGVCQPGPAPSCDDGVSCTTDACSPGADACAHTAVNAACDDGAFCNGAETCSATLGCQAGTAPTVSDGIACTTDSCNESADRIDHTPVNAACDDGAFCNGNETCSAALGCQAGTAPTLSDGIACTTDSCNETTNQVVHTPVNSVCNDGAFCNGTETCSATLGCQAGTAPTLSDGIACTTDTCNEGADRIDHTPVNAACDDGAFCNGNETCSATLGCRAGTAPTVSDGIACTTDSCNETTNQIVHTPVNAACDDGAFCNGSETCSASLGCQAGTAPTVSDGIACTTDSCNETTNQVVHTPVNAVCDDGAFCNGAETCNASVGCIPGSAPVLDDAVSCTLDSCNETTNQVVHTPNAASCNDGIYCNGVESCDTGAGCASPGSGAVSWEMRTASGDPVASGTDQVGCNQSVVVLNDPTLCSGGLGYRLSCSFNASGQLSAFMDGQGACVSFTGAPVTSGCSNASIFASCCFDD